MSDEIPHIYFSEEKTSGLETKKLTVEVRGKELEDCRKQFDEIIKEVIK